MKLKVATYARYSSENQREASIDDQLRDNQALCASHGWPAPMVFSDSEMSGERRDRVGYTSLLRAAQTGRINVLVVWDLKRLSRASDLPQVLERLRFWSVRVVTCDGYDSTRDDSDIRGWIDGMMGNRYLRDLAKATHRGQVGRVLAGVRAGGCPYGYTTTAVRGELAIVPEKAAVVRRIYAEYLSGKSARQIADGLNADGIPSTRGGTWSASAIHGDTRRGIGILTNPTYAGRIVWNRSQKVRHPETGAPIRRERPESEWMTIEKPELRILPLDRWERAQAMLRGRRIEHKNHQRRVHHILSGILRCPTCAGSIIAVDRYRYGCSTSKDRGSSVCNSTLRLDRAEAEHVVLATIREQLLTPAALEQFRRDTARALIAAQPDTSRLERAVQAARTEVQNILAAVRSGIVSPTLQSDLNRAEGELEAQEAALSNARAFTPTVVLPRLEERWKQIVATLGVSTSTTMEIRTAIIDLIGDRIAINENGTGREASAVPSLAVVAGAGFEPATFGL